MPRIPVLLGYFRDLCLCFVSALDVVNSADEAGLFLDDLADSVFSYDFVRFSAHISEYTIF